MEYTLQNCILNTSRLKRREHVLSVLTDNDILNFTDLVNQPLPTKGLWKSEFAYLRDLRQKEAALQSMFHHSETELKRALDGYFTKHEASRVFHVLTANKISSVRLLASASISRLRDIYGIGPKSLDILMKLKTDLWNRAEEDAKYKAQYTQTAIPLAAF